MKNNRIKIVEYIKRTFRSYLFYPCGANIFKSSLVVMLRQISSFLYSFCVIFLHVEGEVSSNEEKKVPVYKKEKLIKDVEVLYKEGLIDIYSITSYVKSHYEKDTVLLVSQERRHSKYHVDLLDEFFKKTYQSRSRSCPIVIKGPTHTFKLIINPFYRSTTKYLQISNIIKKSVCIKKSSTFVGTKVPHKSLDKSLDKSLHKSLQPQREHFFYSKDMNVIDRITVHDRKDVKGSLESLSTFLMCYGDHIYNKNVSWYTHANSDEYKVMVLSDIVSSTRLWCESYEEMSVAITKHDYIALGLVDKYGGLVSRNEGDSFLIFFDNLENAIKFSVKFNKQIQKIKIKNGNLELKMAIHAGIVKMSAGGNYDAHGKPVEEISDFLSQTPRNKISIPKDLFVKVSSGYPDVFHVH